MSEIKNKDTLAFPLSHQGMYTQGLTKYEWMLGQILSGMNANSHDLKQHPIEPYVEAAIKQCDLVFDELERSENDRQENKSI
jgi:hypothetical protein